MESSEELLGNIYKILNIDPKTKLQEELRNIPFNPLEFLN